MHLPSSEIGDQGNRGSDDPWLRPTYIEASRLPQDRTWELYSTNSTHVDFFLNFGNRNETQLKLLSNIMSYTNSNFIIIH